jgi:CheY-like chemotaxis protein
MARTALVVDDSMLIRYTVSRFLEERGYTVESAVNGLEALETVKCRTPDLIVTDLQMPKMSGTELIMALKSEPETAAIPIIVVTGQIGESEEAAKLANFAIRKDIDIETQLGSALDALQDKDALQGRDQSARAQAAGK